MSSLGKLQFALRGKKGSGNGMENILLIGLLILNLIIVGVLIYQNFMKKEKYIYVSEGEPQEFIQYRL